MNPNICFEVFEKNYKGVIFIQDDLTNNPQVLEDLVIRIKGAHDKFIFPHDMPGYKVEHILGAKLYADLIRAYSTKFLDK